MQRFVDRRQMLGHSVSLLAGTLMLGGCGDDVIAAPFNTQLEADVRADFARRDVVMCNGFILSKTEYRLCKKYNLC